MPANHSASGVLALDVGERRIGVSTARLDVRFARPLTTLNHPESFVADILRLIGTEDAAYLVIGLPRGLDSQDTAQTETVRAFGAQLEAKVEIPVYWIDEALTSEKAEAELRDRGKPYVKGDVDALAATYILEDFLKEHRERSDV